MQYKKVGRTGLKVSRICVGAMVYGDQVGESESIRLINAAIEAGINFVDTANTYAYGKSEETVGKAIKGKRDTVVLATKVGSKAGLGPSEGGTSRRHILKAIEDSLRRLQTDYLDLYYAHVPDYDTPLEETLRAMDDLVRQGKVRYVGCSNYSAWLLCKSLWVSDVRNLARFDCIQSPYNLLTRDIEWELLPLCASEGVGVCAYNPLAGELLTGRHEFGQPPMEGRFTHPRLGELYLGRYWSPTNFQAVRRLTEVAREHGCSLAQFSLAWILGNDKVTSVLSGLTSLDQLKENAAATEVALSPEELSACDDVWEMFRLPRYPYSKDLQDRFQKKMAEGSGHT